MEKALVIGTTVWMPAWSALAGATAVVLIDTNLKVPHAILYVIEKDKMLVLDNQFQTVLDSTRIRHYRPIFSLNENGWWAIDRSAWRVG